MPGNVARLEDIVARPAARLLLTLGSGAGRTLVASRLLGWISNRDTASRRSGDGKHRPCGGAHPRHRSWTPQACSERFQRLTTPKRFRSFFGSSHSVVG